MFPGNLRVHAEQFPALYEIYIFECLLFMHQRCLVVGDNVFAPFMAACLRMHKIECDLLMQKPVSKIDNSSIILLPSATEVLGDIFKISVPRGHVVSRMISFDHAGNDISDIDLNKFRQDGISPTFYSCERSKITENLLALCQNGHFRCKVLPYDATLDESNLYLNTDGTVRAKFMNMPYTPEPYTKVIFTTRCRRSTLNLPKTLESLANNETMREAQQVRWLELTVPAIEKSSGIFAPSGHELLEIITNTQSKLMIKPLLFGRKLFYSVIFSMRDNMHTPWERGYNAQMYWQEFINQWASGKPDYINHTLFRPLMQQIYTRSDHQRYLIYSTPSFVLPDWVSGNGNILRVGPSAYSMISDPIDLADATAFSDCYLLAQQLSKSHASAAEWLQNTRRNKVVSVAKAQQAIMDFAFTERSQFAYIKSRFRMKFMGKYRKMYSSILGHMKSVVE